MTSSSRFDALDGFRGLAALAIAVFHFRGGWGGYLAVDFFLLMSGFVLAYRLEIRKETPYEFVAVRIARLYPLHLFSLFVFLVVANLTSYSEPIYLGEFWSAMGQQLTLTHNVGLNPSGLNFNYPSWSVSVEFWVNVLFVVIYRFSKQVIWLLIPAFGCLAVIWMEAGNLNVHYQNAYGWLNLGLLRGFALFVIGVCIFRYRPDELRISLAGLDLVSIIVLSLILVTVFQLHTSHADFLVVALFAGLVFLASYDQGHIARLAARFSPLGKISYSIYLNQIFLLILVRFCQELWSWNTLLSFAVYLVALLAVSVLTYVYVEQYFKRRMQNMLVLK